MRVCRVFWVLLLFVTLVLSETTKKPKRKIKIIKSNQSNHFKSLKEKLSLKPTKSSMLMIPIPLPQQKPYQPVIMQNSKNESESKVLTYKLNKMFIPMGIYGKVLNQTGKNMDVDSIKITNEKVDADKISFTTGRSDVRFTTENYKDFLRVPGPLEVSSTEKSYFNLPGLIHQGISSVGGFFSGSSSSSRNDQVGSGSSHYGQISGENVIASVPGGRLPFVKKPRPVHQNQHQKMQPKMPLGLGTLLNFENLKGGRSLGQKWRELQRKYSSYELENAKEKILGMIDGEEVSQRERSGAFREMYGMFRDVFERVDSSKSREASSSSSSVEDSWRPVSYERPTQKYNYKPTLQKVPKPHTKSLLPPPIEAFKNEPEVTQESVNYESYKEQESDSEYELVPYTSYFKNSNYGEIAAVVKPEGVSDSVVESVVGPNHRVFSYGDGESLKNVENYLKNGISQNLLRENEEKAKVYREKEESFYELEHPQVPQNNKKTFNRRNDEEILERKLEELEQLQKEFKRKQIIQQEREQQENEFKRKQIIQQEQEQEQQKQKRILLSQSYYNSLLTQSKPQEKTVKFFAPIPLNSHLIKETLRGRYKSPVPKYVVELANKLKRDRDVQGIVRVRSLDGVEYLYPVRG